MFLVRDDIFPEGLDNTRLEIMKSDKHTSQDETPDFTEAIDLGDACAAGAAEQSGAEEQSSAAEDEVVTISKAEYEKLQSELAEAKDRGLRALAELENFRARTNRLHAEERKYASLDLARAILPVWDNLALALSIDDPQNNGAAVLDGVKMVYDEFHKILEQNGIQKIEALHQPFDPNFHESVAFMPSDEYPANTVLVEIKAGFKLHERVVRAAQVVLAAPQPAKPAAE